MQKGNLKNRLTFDDALAINIPEFRGASPLNSGEWLDVLSDLAEGLYNWYGNIDFYDLLLIEKYIFRKNKFALIHTKYRQGNAIISKGFHIFKVTPITYFSRYQVKTLRIVIDRKPENLILNYDVSDFVYFDNFTYTIPYTLAMKYSEVLANLDALYMQCISKLSIPIIGVGFKNLKNDLINIFKRTRLNALYTLVNGDYENHRMQDAFFNPQIEFILDKVNMQRQEIMKEYIQELGINPNIESLSKSQYQNNRELLQNSLISKYFSASLNKYRTNFCNKCNEKFDLKIGYEPTVSFNETDIIGEKMRNE